MAVVATKSSALSAILRLAIALSSNRSAEGANGHVQCRDSNRRPHARGGSEGPYRPRTMRARRQGRRLRCRLRCFTDTRSWCARCARARSIEPRARGVILCRNPSARSASPRTGSSKCSLRARQKLDYPITFQHRTPSHTATATGSNGRRVTARSAPSRRSPALRANAALQVRPAHAVKFTHRF